MNSLEWRFWGYYEYIKHETLNIKKKAPEAQVLQEPFYVYFRNNFMFFFRRRTARSRIWRTRSRFNDMRSAISAIV